MIFPGRETRSRWVVVLGREGFLTPTRWLLRRVLSRPDAPVWMSARSWQVWQRVIRLVQSHLGPFQGGRQGVMWWTVRPWVVPQCWHVPSRCLMALLVFRQRCVCRKSFGIGTAKPACWRAVVTLRVSLTVDAGRLFPRPVVPRVSVGPPVLRVPMWGV